jgi:hypothetical protein
MKKNEQLKSMLVSEEVHGLFKNYCKKRGYKINSKLEEIITNFLVSVSVEKR